MSKFNRFYIEINEKCEIINCNSEFLIYTGRDDLKNLEYVIPTQDIITFRDILFATEKGGNSLICFRVKNSEDKLSWMAATIHKPADTKDLIRLDIQDIQSMKTDATGGYYDAMTGLFSKSAITEYAQDLMRQVPKKQFYFCLMDVDNFKAINDTYGHMRGDEVIIDVAQIAKKCIGDTGYIGRIGGDEFMLVFDGINEESKLREVLRDIRYTIREKYMDEDNNKTVTASIGGGLFPDYAADYDEMFMLADKMLYLAKTKGRDRYVIYTPAVHGNLKYDGDVMTLSQHMTQNNVKNALIMDLMIGFLRNRDVDYREAFEQVVTTYLLDAVYVVDKKTGKSRFGLEVIEDEKGDKQIVDSEIDFSGLDPEDYQPVIETFPIKVCNMYDLQKGGYNKFSDYMLQNGYRILVTYYLKNIKEQGYIVYVNTRNSACRFSETDFADLTYFSRMLECSGQCP